MNTNFEYLYLTNKHKMNILYCNMNKLPNELILEITDFIDYEKYCKPVHQNVLKNVLEDILDMSTIIGNDVLSPQIAYECWGKGWQNK